MPPVPAFTVDGTQFDHTSWVGRTRHFYALTNPAYLFARYTLPTAAPSSVALEQRALRTPRPSG
ncbi:MAG: hypothetical protein ACPIOQ_31640 [Promethearchaeia archaeon]